MIISAQCFISSIFEFANSLKTFCLTIRLKANYMYDKTRKSACA